MPRMDRSGPWGNGPGTGRGLGPCGATAVGWNYAGFGRGQNKRGMGRGWYNRPWTIDNEKTILEDEEKYLEQELEAVRKERAVLKS